MKNTIMKSYMKKILRSEAFVSVIIVFVLALGIIGTSYALYMDVDTDSDYHLVKTGDLSISYSEGDDIISLDQVLPLEDEDVMDGTASPVYYTFSIFNNGNYNAVYDIKLENLSNSDISLEDINYLLCKENCEGKTISDIKSLSQSANMLLHSDKILKGATEGDTYVLKIWLDSGYDGNVDRDLKLKLVVEARNEGIKSLADTIMYDSRIVKNEGNPVFSNSETEEVGMYSAEDDYGESWYFRGKQSYNYVNFAGFTWRVVRINGDGTVRMILDGTLDKMSINNTLILSATELAEIDADGVIAFKINPYNDNAYIGYMYGDASTSNYDLTHDNKNSSNIKNYIDKFYELYLEENEDYLADTLFCGDKSLSSGYLKDSSGYGTINTQYAAYKRLVTDNNPTLKCALGETNDYSRYTAYDEQNPNRFDSSDKTSTGVVINNDLTYPIALLSADELVMAGGKYKTNNTSYYLYNDTTRSYGYWWTMTPYDYSNADNRAGVFFGRDTAYTLGNYYVGNPYGVRPVINLKSDAGIKEGNGTKETPYVIEEFKN